MSADLVWLACCCCLCVCCCRVVVAEGAYCDAWLAAAAAYSVGGTRSVPAGAALAFGEGLAAEGTARETDDATSDPSLRAGLEDDDPMLLYAPKGETDEIRLGGQKDEGGNQARELTLLTKVEARKARRGSRELTVES